TRLMTSMVTAVLLAVTAACSSPAARPAGRPAGAGASSGLKGQSAPAGCGRATETVATAAQLAHALASAQPGTAIGLSPGVYRGDFVANVSGTASAAITLCGGRTAVLQGRSVSSGYTIHLQHASYWRLEGFTVVGGQKGVVTDGSSYDVIEGLYVHGTGDEAIHLRSFSSHDVVNRNVIRDAGLDTPSFGEGIYVGSAHSNWCRYSGCNPDASNDNVITNNNISNTTAENIDIKEGTRGGTIVGNRLDGAGMVTSAATAWINVKGNDWKILDNAGVNSPGDGYQVHQVYPGWGIANTFLGNKATLTGSGVGIYVQSHHLQTIVGCNNAVSGAELSNVPCAPAD
ncbi:MAG: right-handed parallel beta-helix repeat-containing protein, partial [Actinobacteria bacterium]|nr:right-handed parallel beta-helix repeat-containing protein [Actinomycetota bacterium]